MKTNAMAPAFVLLVVAALRGHADDVAAAARSVVIRAHGLELQADAIDARWEGLGAARIVLRGVSGRPAELRVTPEVVDADAKASRHLRDGVRLVGDELVVVTSSTKGEDGATRERLEISGAMRWQGSTFSLDCSRVRFSPHERLVEIDGARDIRIDLDGRRRLPPIALASEALDVKIDDLGLAESYDVVLRNAEGFEARLDGARVRVRTLVLHLSP